MAYPKKILGDYVNIKTGKLDVNAESESGKYPFFTCAREPHAIDEYAYDCECVLVAGNGDLNVKYYEGKFNAYQRTYIIESKNETYIDVKYLYFFLEQYIERLREGSIGGVIKYIKLEHLTDIEIPLPPLETQKQIAAVLEKADQLRKDCQRVEEELNALAQSVFLEMFGDPAANTKNWITKELLDICDKITDGTHKTPEYTGEGVKFLSAKNISNGVIDWNDTKFISEEEHRELIKRCNPEYGDVLLSKSGTIGVAALVDKETEFSLFESVALLKYRRNAIRGEFLLYFLNCENLKHVYLKNTKGNSIKHLHLVEIRGLDIPLPPMDLQELFVNRIEQLNSIQQSNAKKSIEVNNLFNSILQKAFKDELEFKEIRKAA